MKTPTLMIVLLMLLFLVSCSGEQEKNSASTTPEPGNELCVKCDSCALQNDESCNQSGECPMKNEECSMQGRCTMQSEGCSMQNSECPMQISNEQAQSGEKSETDAESSAQCAYCGQYGHLIPACPHLKS